MSGRMAMAVIGAGFGDEGKGLATDALAVRMMAEGDPVTVVRSNGGAQAGHGVSRPDGSFHVFHHVGAGSLAGAGTQLSRHFVAHPMVFGNEIAALAGLGVRPVIGIDPRAPVTTPFDMLLNQAAEMSRGTSRHGSTGLGFGETIERTEHAVRIRAGDLVDERILGDALRDVAAVWVPARARALGIDPDSEAGRFLDRQISRKHELIDRFLEDVRSFRRSVFLRPDAETPGRILFEGAQGLDLDMKLGEMPHVTRSLTGLPNMIDFAREAGLTGIAPLYVTRAYRTRHGAGPLEGERDMSRDLKIVDRTNIDNPWQGRIRAAPLDPEHLARQVARDIARGRAEAVDLPAFPIAPALGVTCLDQIRGKRIPVLRQGSERRVPQAGLVEELQRVTGLPVGLLSFGPSREDVLVET